MRISLGRLKWFTIVLPIAFLAIAQAVAILAAKPTPGTTAIHLVATAVIAVFVVAFSTVVFRVVGRMQQRIVHQNEELSALNAESQALHEIGLNITSLQDIHKTLQSIVEQARQMLGSEAAALCLARGNGCGMALASRSGPGNAFLRSPVQVPPFPLTGAEVSGQACGPAACPTLAEEYRACHLAAPLTVGASMIGGLCVSSREPRRFAERHRQLLAGLAGMAAIAIDNARLLEGERQLAVLEERDRLAREMHDSLAQVLGYLHLKAQVTKRVLAQADLAKAHEEVDNIASLADEAYRDVREAILDLRERVSPAAGIVGTLKDYVLKFSRQTGIAATLEVPADGVSELSPEVEIQLLRVVQEALTNVRKHAAADRACVRIAPGAGKLSITVEDNGRGFDPALIHRSDGRRLGVQVMRERVERVGGRFEIETAPGRGTRVRIEFGHGEGSSDDPD